MKAVIRCKYCNTVIAELDKYSSLTHLNTLLSEVLSLPCPSCGRQLSRVSMLKVKTRGGVVGYGEP